jgi:hypothetical protein
MAHYDGFVKKHFAEIPEENIRWFLNFGSIQSVPGLEVPIRPVESELRTAFSCLVEGCPSGLCGENNDSHSELNETIVLNWGWSIEAGRCDIKEQIQVRRIAPILQMGAVRPETGAKLPGNSPNRCRN